MLNRGASLYSATLSTRDLGYGEFREPARRVVDSIYFSIDDPRERLYDALDLCLETE